MSWLVLQSSLKSQKLESTVASKSESTGMAETGKQKEIVNIFNSHPASLPANAWRFPPWTGWSRGILDSEH